jgi:predicted DNA binding protein
MNAERRPTNASPGASGRPRGARPSVAAGPTTDRLAVMKLEIATPPDSWYGPFSVRHPELVIEVTNVMTLENGDSLAEYEIYGPPVDWTPEIRGYPDVIEVVSLGARTEYGLYNVRYRQSSVITIVRELEVLVRYPRTVRAGLLEAEVIAPVVKMRELVDRLEKNGNRPRLMSVRRDSLRSVHLVLTPVQRTLFRQALASGYFEVPRRITLTRLATKVGRSISTVSATLATVEKKLAQAADAMVA